MLFLTVTTLQQEASDAEDNLTEGGLLAASTEAAQAENKRAAAAEKESKSFLSKNKSAAIEDFQPNMAYVVKVGEQDPIDVLPTGNVARDASTY